MNPIEKSILIDSNPSAVWRVLTEPELMKQWMGEPEMRVEISTGWETGGPVIISGFHHVKFVNKGTVLQFDPEKALRYTQLSSVSRLPDVPESYTLIEFTLRPEGDRTLLTLRISNFPTETIYKHLDFYWRATIVMIKDCAEKQSLAEGVETA